MTDINVDIEGSSKQYNKYTESQKDFSGTQGGSIPSSEAGTVVLEEIKRDESIEIHKVVFSTGSGLAPPNNTNISIVKFDGNGGYTVQKTMFSGDGSTTYLSETGAPLFEYENESSGRETVGVIIENNQSSNSFNAFATVEGRIE